MCGTNFLFGNNFGFGRFGFGCFCRPMINPFMLGAMQGYTSAMCAYSMMGGIFYTPSLFNFSGFMYPQNYNYNNNYSYQNNTEQLDNNNEPEEDFSDASLDEMIKRAQNSSKDLTEALKPKDSANTEIKPSSVSKDSNVETEHTEVKSTKDFKTKVMEVAKSVGCNYEDLLALMNSESGLDPKAQNKSGQGAVGLLQFTTPAIKELNRHGINITKEELLAMDAVEQMDYVEKYLKIAKSYKFADDYQLSAGELYAINYLPGRASRYILASRGDIYYEANKGLDVNKDGNITTDDLAQRLNKFKVSLVA